MAKKGRKIKLTYLLLHFVILNTFLIGLIFFSWFWSMLFLQNQGIIYPANYSEQQVNHFIENQSGKISFDPTGIPNQVDYVLFGEHGEVLKSNANETNLKKIQRQYQNYQTENTGYSKYTYPDKTTILFYYNYAVRYVNQTAQKHLPRYELLSLCVAVILTVIVLGLTTRKLRRKLVTNLNLFTDVGRNITRQNLEFTVPDADIKEFDSALNAMEQMRIALKSSLSAQWIAEQQRQAEISSLAHDLKTPLTLIKGNAELLLEDQLYEEQSKMVETIINNSRRAEDYVAVLLSASVGLDEEFGQVAIIDFFHEVSQRANEMGKELGIQITTSCNLSRIVTMQYSRFLRAVINLVQNALEHTLAGETVQISFETVDDLKWQIQIQDEGTGFSNEAIKHSRERFWRDDKAREMDGHSGLGMWFANEVVNEHGGDLEIKNSKKGGIITIQIPFSSQKRIVKTC